jgi:crotonobetainyl-CoA:carnitine CoA-transferase CaiB-like acyl-CoA transferase
MVSALRDTASLYSYMGAVRWRRPEHTGDIPRTPTEVRDGHVVPISFGGVDWETTADFLDEPRLREPRFSTPEGRVANARELDKVLRESFAGRSKFETFYEAQKRRGLIYGVVQTPQDVVESPQYRARGYFEDIEHPAIGTATYPGAPFLMSETPWQASSPAPTLGQHNHEILCGKLGYLPGDLTRLGAEGVI